MKPHRPKATSDETAARIREKLLFDAVIPALKVIEEETEIEFTHVTISFRLKERPTKEIVAVMHHGHLTGAVDA